MSYHSTTIADALPTDAGRQVAQLHAVLRQVEEIAGAAGSGSSAGRLEQAAQISAAYERSLPVVRRRFDALAEETATWSAVALKALLTIRGHGNPPRAAAAQLARELQQALRELAAVIRSQ